MTDAKKLSSMDASFLYLETPEMPMHVGSMAIFRLPENYNGNFFEDFKAMIASRLHLASHIGLGVNPAALWAVADRLAQGEGEFKQFDRSGPFAIAYGPPENAQS